jgi:hypothetical protein
MLTIQTFEVWKEHDGVDPTSRSSNRRTLGGERLNDIVDGGVVKVLHFLSKQSSWLGTFEVIVVGIFVNMIMALLLSMFSFQLFYF